MLHLLINFSDLFVGWIFWPALHVTPVFKKSEKSEFENYRPVMCLPAAAKLLELVACQQTSKYMEDNNLIPKSQHGFRSQRSTI